MSFLVIIVIIPKTPGKFDCSLPGISRNKRGAISVHKAAAAVLREPVLFCKDLIKAPNKIAIYLHDIGKEDFRCMSTRQP